MCKLFGRKKKTEQLEYTNEEQDRLIAQWLERTRIWASQEMYRTSADSREYRRASERFNAAETLLDYLKH